MATLLLFIGAVFAPHANATKVSAFQPSFQPQLQAGDVFVDFEEFTVGSPNGQHGWEFTGPYDVAIVAPPYPSFGARALRISNAVTSGSFGDWVFSQSLPNEAGESDADSGGLSGGIRQPHFEVSFDIASYTPGIYQPGLQISTSPDQGNGARMSFLRFRDDDAPNGLAVDFADYNHAVQDFNPAVTVASSLSRSVPHRIKIAMDFFDGVANDRVRVYVDGTLVETGGSWEDFFRDFQPVGTNAVSRTVDSLLLQARTGSGTAPGTLGKGFVIDNLVLHSGPIDSDGDGVPDDADTCPNSVLGKGNVSISNVNTGIPNVVTASGCSLRDLLLQCATPKVTRSQFVACVTATADVLYKNRTISGEQRTALINAANTANLPPVIH